MEDNGSNSSFSEEISINDNTKPVEAARGVYKITQYMDDFSKFSIIIESIK